MKSFEEKCRRLYETRLAEYVTRTDVQLAEYENQLLSVGGNLALERTRFESRLRRLKLSCSRSVEIVVLHNVALCYIIFSWKADYQKEVHVRYCELSASLEGRYLSELEALLQELASSREVMTQLEHKVPPPIPAADWNISIYLGPTMRACTF